MPISMSDSEGTKNHQVSYPVLFHVHGGSTEGIEELPQQMERESTSLETGNEQQGGQAEIENSHSSPGEM